LIGKGKPIEPKNGVVEIWSYTDVNLQSEHEKTVSDLKFLAAIDVEDHRLIRLQREEEEWFQFSKFDDNIALVESPQVEEVPWNATHKRNWDLVTLKNGSRKHLNFLDINNIGSSAGGATLSPCGKYIVYFDRKQQAYFSYEIATGTTRNLSKGINILWNSMDENDSPNLSLAAWMKDDESVLVYDNYDVWKLDPLNKEKPINVTNGYGRKNRIVFKLTFTEDISRDSRLYLTAFNKENKNNGFFLKPLGKAGDPELLHMGPYLYQTNSSYVPGYSDFQAIKAKGKEMYIVRRMSASDAPNYFSTKDFKTFIRLSNLQPQKRYNWYTTELHTWKSLDGRKLQGILYKPENFDPNKKYPVIFHYYERKSDGLNAFITPEVLCGMCNIDIPTYVSNGYLVFTPDIYYKIGDPMQGTYDAIVSAANYMSRLPFVNDKKIGLQGCSYGGLQTNYLITHTDKFAAAVPASGLSDMISAYGDIYPDGGRSMEMFFESGQIRMGKSLWDVPESYIKNSPIFNIQRVSTPVLIMHTKKDGSAASYKDAQQFFTGLRRMGKKAWMLVYSDGNHGIWKKEEVNDFSVRMMQFFDHYLKDKPAPQWMLDGVPAENRNWNAGLELDTKGRTPGLGLLTPEEQVKVDAMMTRKPLNIILK
jgi:dienelactone hydrolase